MDKSEEKALNDIANFGCHVLRVLEEEGHPPFCYSIGIKQSSGQPELIVAGLNPELAHSMINQYNDRVRAGEYFLAGQRASGFLEGFDIEFREVHSSHYRNYFGWGIWLYKGTDFKVLQAVWPTTKGKWPWDDHGSDWYQYVQPLLDEPVR
ncbi:MAG: DUF4262 domain-containing protein [Betaproteobacteria bacterium]|nr:DUF4262 domain-containing protein [Betaproteobacteria bacterium]